MTPLSQALDESINLILYVASYVVLKNKEIEKQMKMNSKH